MNQNQHNKLCEDVASLNRAVFGDKELDEKGIKEKVDEMYDIVKTMKGGRKAILWLASLIAAVGTIAYFFKGGFK